MWNLRNKAEDHRGRDEKMKQDETREGDKPQETLNLRKQTEGCWKGEGVRGMWLGDGHWGGYLLW